jgi:hypothetical protein
MSKKKYYQSNKSNDIRLKLTSEEKIFIPNNLINSLLNCSNEEIEKKIKNKNLINNFKINENKIIKFNEKDNESINILNENIEDKNENNENKVDNQNENKENKEDDKKEIENDNDREIEDGKNQFENLTKEQTVRLQKVFELFQEIIKEKIIDDININCNESNVLLVKNYTNNNYYKTINGEIVNKFEVINFLIF